MTSREIVERAITFNNPPRLPMKFDVVGVNDCHDVWTHDPTGWTWNFEHEATDEWSCLWRQSDVLNTGQVVGHPLQNLDALADFRWPDPDDPKRYRDFEQQLAGAGDRFVMFCFGHGVFERLHMLHGMTETMMDFHRKPKPMHEIIERILDHHLRVFRNVVKIAADYRAKTGSTVRIDAAALADDWGLQDRAFLSTKLFREFYSPVYKRWFDEIKTAGAHTWMHSCGRINEMLEELIACGLEVVNPQQPNVVGLEEFGKRFQGRVCFESIVDTQSTLPRGTYDEIRAQARDLLDKWATPAGGFIASDYNDAEAIGVTLDRRLVMFEAFAEKGGYPNYKEILEQRPNANTGHLWGRKQKNVE